MSIETQNTLYCMSNEEHDITSGTPGIAAMKHDYFYQSRLTQRLDEQALIELGVIELFFLIFAATNERHRYIYTFSDVTEQNFSQARLKYEFKRMYLVENSSQEDAIRDAANMLMRELPPRNKLEQEDIDEITIKYIEKLESICGLLS